MVSWDGMKRISDNTKEKMTNDEKPSEKKSLEEAEREYLEYYHNGQDQKDNESSIPPPEEEVRVPTIWAIEAYPPTYIENLWKGLERLGVLTSERSSAVTDFLENIRTRAFGGGSVNLDPILRDDKYLLHGVKGPLPRDVSEIRLSLYQVVPSTTLLICQFYLESDSVSSLETALRADYSTYSIKKGKGVTFIDVTKQKEEAVAIARELMLAKGTDWVKENIPGYFCSHNSSFGPPTCELITFKQYDPSEAENQRNWGIKKSYTVILNVDSEFHLRKSDEVQGLYLQVDNPQNRYPNRMTLTGKADNILANIDIKAFGRDHESRILNWSRYLDKTFATWALHVLSIDMEKQLLTARDSYGSLDISTISNAIDRLFELDHNYSYLQRNLTPFAHDLQSYCNREHSFMHDVYEFKPVKELKHRKELFGTLRLNLLMRSTELISIESQISSSASRLGQSISTMSADKLAKSNLKLQQQVALMSLLVLLLTIVQVGFLIKDYTIDWESIGSLLRYLTG